MDERIWKAALAGLFHDIGKLEQRARVDPWNPAPGVAREGQPVHATWSVYFATNYVPEPYRAAALAGAYHHFPEKAPGADKHLSTLVSLADKLSAGERSDLASEEKGSALPQQLVTIFDRLALDNGAPQVKNYLPLKPLELNETVIFPSSADMKISQGEAYDNLRQEMEQTIRQPQLDVETFLENALEAMRRFTWCVPSAYYHSVPDISLYDHSRMTAALAVCLAGVDDKRVNQLLEAVRRDFEGKREPDDAHILGEPAVLLVGGDISGVQDFIYTLSSKGAAQTLRGRSFYLQLLTEAILRYLLHGLGLPSTNVIYSGGGHFYLLAPLEAAQKLVKIQQYITQTLLQHHGSALYLALGSVEVPASGFKLGAFPAYWANLHTVLARAKLSRYGELDKEIYAQVFTPQTHGGNRENHCVVCGEDREHTTELEGDAEGGRICSMCSSFADDIGKPLPGKRFVLLGMHKPGAVNKDNAAGVLGAFGMEVKFASSDRDRVIFDEKTERAIIWALGDTDRWPVVENIPAARVVRYTLNLLPKVADHNEAEQINEALSTGDRQRDPARPDQPKTFTHLQTQAEGIPRLGVLRMDLDNLSDLFNRGFDKGEHSRASLARLSTLSFQVSLFFEGWIKHLCEERGNLIYAVYAGGDDLFLIGPWDQIPSLAHKITSDLARFTGFNQYIHISGGMAFIQGKYPVYQAAEDSAGALELAKTSGKNAFGFLGQAWSWPSFEKLTEKQERLYRLTQEKGKGGLGGPQALLQVLRRLSIQEADKAKRFKGRPVWGPWMWVGAYQFTRRADLAKNTPELQSELMAIREELKTNNYREIGQWGAAARWAELRLRVK